MSRRLSPIANAAGLNEAPKQLISPLVGGDVRQDTEGREGSRHLLTRAAIFPLKCKAFGPSHPGRLAHDLQPA